MISWLQINLQRHFRFVFIILLVVLVVAFVFTIGNQGPLSSAGGTGTANFFGTPVSGQTAQARIRDDAALSARLQFQQPNLIQAYSRLTALHLADKNGIPSPTDEQLKGYLESIRIFQGPDGKFSATQYSSIKPFLLANGTYSESDLARVLKDDYRIEQLYTVLQGKGHVLDSEILATIEMRKAKWDVLIAEGDLANHKPDLEITEEMLKQRYEEFKESYMTPERRKVKYVEFKAADYTDEVKVEEADLIDFFESNISRYQPQPAPDAAEDAPAPEAVAFEDVRARVRADYIARKAADIGYDRATDLIVTITNDEIERDSDAFEQLIADSGVELKTSSPFSASETPIGTPWGRSVVEQAFRLNESIYYTDPQAVGGVTYVLFYDSVIDPELPSFGTLENRLIADVQNELLREARAAHADKVKEELAAAADAAAFRSIAEEKGLTIKDYDSFTLVEPAEDLNNRYLQSISELKPGEVSAFVRPEGGTKGGYAFVVAKEVPEITPEDEDYTETKEGLSSVYGQYSALQYIETLTIDEMSRLGLLSPNQG